MNWRRRKEREDDLERELRSDLELEAEEQRERGLPPGEAQYAARRALGDTTILKEEVREMWGWHSIERLGQDLRFAVRGMRRNPGMTTVAIVTLALGIGANTAIFSIVDAVLLRPLPFKDPGRLVDLTEYSPGRVDSAGVPFPDYLIWKQDVSKKNAVFEETAAYSLIHASNDIVLGGSFSAERARYSTVTNSFFTMLGVHPALGHGFSAREETAGGAKTFLASDALWRRVFGGDPRSIGKTYLLDGENYTLAGVMPPGFDFPKGCGVWLPTGTLGERGLRDRVSHPFHVLGRLRPGANLAQADAQIESIQEFLGKVYPNTDSDWRVHAQPLLDEVVGNVRASLFVLLGAVGFILLIACTNVVNLMLARASARQKEFATRAALGAGRGRLLCQNLTEAFVIVAASVGLAVALAKWGMDLVISLVSIQLPRMESFHLSLPVFVFTAVVAVLTAILVGLAPALQASRQESVRVGQRSGTPDSRTQRLRNALVVSEVALALLLLCGAGLMLRSFLRLNSVHPGFEAEHLLTVKIALPGRAYPTAAQTSAYLDRLLKCLQSLPGMRDAAATTMLPLSGESDWGSFQIVGRPAQDWAHASAAEARAISANYFRTLGIPLLRGRVFTPADTQTRNTVIINEAMAKKFWPGQDPIGQHIVNVERSNPSEIIGIVADVKNAGLDTQSKPGMYTLYSGWWYMYLVLRTNQAPASVIPVLRAQVAAVDKNVPVYQVATMDELLNTSIAPQRFNLFLLALFAALALVLAAVGIYGVLAFSMTRRSHEIGIHLALGARHWQILRLIVWQGMKPVLIGIVIGVFAAGALTRLMSSLLFQVSSTDPTTFAAVAVLLALIASLACYIPARQALRVDPMTALRHD
jgi:putative ABC transport system permease protein